MCAEIDRGAAGPPKDPQAPSPMPAPCLEAPHAARPAPPATGAAEHGHGCTTTRTGRATLGPWLGAVSRDRDREPTARRHRDDDTLMTRSRNINISSIYISAADAIDVTARIDDILALVAGPAAGSGHPGVSAHVSRLSNACTIAIVVRDGDAWTVASRLRLESYSRNQHWHHVESWIMTGAGSWRHARSPMRPEDRRGQGTGPGVARSRSTRQAASPVCRGEHGRRGRGLAAQRVAGGRDGEAGERRGATAQHACGCTHPNGRGGGGLHALECAGGDGGRRVSAEAASGAS